MYTQKEKDNHLKIRTYAHEKHGKLISEMSNIFFIKGFHINVFNETIRFGVGYEVHNCYLKEMFELCDKHGFNLITAEEGIWLSKYI
jgi:hypothetical protein